MKLLSPYSNIRPTTGTGNSGAFTYNGYLLSYVSDNRTLDVILCKQSDFDEADPVFTVASQLDESGTLKWQLYKERVHGLNRQEWFNSEELANYCLEQLVAWAED